jgi:hypothetical protein
MRRPQQLPRLRCPRASGPEGPPLSRDPCVQQVEQEASRHDAPEIVSRHHHFGDRVAERQLLLRDENHFAMFSHLAPLLPPIAGQLRSQQVSRAFRPLFGHFQRYGHHPLLGRAWGSLKILGVGVGVGCPSNASKSLFPVTIDRCASRPHCAAVPTGIDGPPWLRRLMASA